MFNYVEDDRRFRSASIACAESSSIEICYISWAQCIPASAYASHPSVSPAKKLLAVDQPPSHLPSNLSLFSHRMGNRSDWHRKARVCQEPQGISSGLECSAAA